MESKSKQMSKNMKTVHGSKRTYFINQDTLKEETIIKITESKRIAPEVFKRIKIVIYEEDMELVIDALQQVQEEIKDRK